MDELKDIFTNINEWLRFAERKNALLLAADSAVAFTLLRLVVVDMDSNVFVKWYTIFVISLLGLAILICLLSFVPQVKIPWLLPEGKKLTIDNLVFYGHIAKYDPQEFLSEFYRRCSKNTEEITALEKDYAAQIVINSRITTTKFEHFTTAIWITIAAIVTPLVALILFLHRDRD